MNKKKLFTAILCLAGLVFIGCTKQENIPDDTSAGNPLANTKWEGEVLQTDLSITFTSDECYIQASGYANGVAVGSYKTNQTDLFITITKTSGSFDAQLSKDDILIGSFDLDAKQMTVKMSLYGEMQTIVLRMKGSSSNNPNQPVNPDSYSELILGKWHCTQVYEHVDGENDIEVVDIHIVVNADHTYQKKVYNSEWETGTWSLTGSQLYAGGAYTFQIIKLTATELNLRLGDSNEYEEFHFVRE